MTEKESEQKNTDAICVLSGGQDSTTCLFWALEQWEDVEAVTFDYGQRHKVEIGQAEKICKEIGVPWTLIKVSGFNSITHSSLLDGSDITINKETGVPSTFVPGRNIVFLTYAAALAFTKGCHNLVTGVCQTDYSGYADCRDSSIKALQGALTLGMDYDICIHTPLMWMTKAESIGLALHNGAIHYLGHTLTCYEGKSPACGQCPACKLRIAGFKEVGIKDPLEYVIDIDWENCVEVNTIDVK